MRLAVRLDLQPERSGSEGADDGVSSEQARFQVGDDRAHAVQLRGSDMDGAAELALYPMRVEMRRALSVQREAPRDFAFGSAGRQRSGIDLVGGELKVPDRTFLQGRGDLRRDPATARVEPQVEAAVFPSLFRSASPRTGLPTPHRPGPTPDPAAAPPGLAAGLRRPAARDPRNHRRQTAPSELQAKRLEADGPSPRCRRAGRPARARPAPPGRGQLGGELQRGGGGIRPVIGTRLSDVQVPQRERRIGAQLGTHGDGTGAQLQVAHVRCSIRTVPRRAGAACAA